MSLVRIWFAGTAAVLAGMALWAFAPVLVFVAILLAALALLCLGMVGLAQIVRRWRERTPG